MKNKKNCNDNQIKMWDSKIFTLTHNFCNKYTNSTILLIYGFIHQSYAYQFVTPRDGFLGVENINFPGFDILNITPNGDVTNNTCLDICAALSDCNFIWVPPSSFGNCDFKKGELYPNSTSAFINGVLIQNIRITAQKFDYKSISKNNYSDCKQYCIENSECLFWTFDHNSNICFLEKPVTVGIGHIYWKVNSVSSSSTSSSVYNPTSSISTNVPSHITDAPYATNDINIPSHTTTPSTSENFKLAVGLPGIALILLGLIIILIIRRLYEPVADDDEFIKLLKNHKTSLALGLATALFISGGIALLVKSIN